MNRGKKMKGKTMKNELCIELERKLIEYKELNNNLTDQLEHKQDKLDQIETWTRAYPLQIFPKPDYKKANEVLQKAGLSLGQITGGAMRHVLKGIIEIIEKNNNEND